MISIRPEVAMYAAFARLNYKPWYALAEFVDNSLQSALNNVERLRQLNANYVLRVEIDIDDESIEIRDNAGGISTKDYPRAFLPASPPPDTTGLSEFGLGMKAAASWFAEYWSVRTSAVDEDVERTIEFDIPSIVATNTDQLQPIEHPSDQESHFTTLRFERLRIRPRGRTLTKIHDHLSSIYRLFISDGFLELRLNGQPLSHEAPTFLEAPLHSSPNGQSKIWKKDFDLDLGDGHRVKGWAGILARASVANAGFAVFRRRRLVIGSHGEGYRPESLFGKPNKFVYQRLVGQLEVEGFSVSHTKDGIQWTDWEDDILAWLKDELDAKPLPLLQQATHYRARPVVSRDAIAEAARDTSTAIVQHLPPIIEQQLEAPPDGEDLEPQLEPIGDPAPATTTETVEMHLEHANTRWIVSIEIVSEVSRDSWFEIAECELLDENTKLEIRLNLGHPFLVRFVAPNGDEIVPFARLAAGFAVAEVTARRAGIRQAGAVRKNLNQILKNALSGPIQAGNENA